VDADELGEVSRVPGPVRDEAGRFDLAGPDLILDERDAVDLAGPRGVVCGVGLVRPARQG
jgi:hypothetical protein